MRSVLLLQIQKSLPALALLLVLLPLPQVSIAETGDWKEQAHRDGIRTWTRKITGSKYRAVRGETVLEASVARLVAVINDAEGCPEWADLCARSFVQQQVSPAEAFVYTLNDMPWPVKDREVLAHVRWQREGSSVRMQSNAVPGNIDGGKRDAVRIEQASASWRFTPLDDGRTSAEFEIHMDPNGAIPGWLLNRLVVNAPFNTFRSLEKQAGKQKYDNREIPF